MPGDTPQNDGLESSFLKIFFQGVKPPKKSFASSRVQRKKHTGEEECDELLEAFREKMRAFVLHLPVKEIIVPQAKEKEIPVAEEIPSAPFLLADAIPQIFESRPVFSSENIRVQNFDSVAPQRSSRREEIKIVATPEAIQSTEKKISDPSPQEIHIEKSELNPLEQKEKIPPILKNAFNTSPQEESEVFPEKEEVIISETKKKPVFRESRGKQPFYDAPHIHISHFASYRVLEPQPRKKKKPLPDIPQSSAWKEFIHVGSLALGLFVISFVGFNFSSIATISESYWNAKEYTQKQTALTSLTDGSSSTVKKVEALPVAGITTQNTDIPFLDLTVNPPDTRIIIPKIAKNIPIIDVPESSLKAENWNQLEKDIQEGLHDGVAHYPGTAEPGEEGNVFITGHSSYYPWDTGRYKDVFASLHQLDVGDHYFIYYKGKKYEYAITERKIVKPNDTSVLKQPEGKKIATLMTCTPVGTALNRLILVAEQV
ncbi:MAG: sortase [Candidatus Peregrinibacteria bacterium]